MFGKLVMLSEQRKLTGNMLWCSCAISQLWAISPSRWFYRSVES